MPIFNLTDELVFPHPDLAEPEGILAIGGDLSPERLILAYSNGIFPWYNQGEPIQWWSLNPRLILYPDKFKCSDSLRRTLKSGKYEVKINQNFRQLIQNCANVSRKGETGLGTWISDEMMDAYTKLHEMGYAHCIETHYKGEMVGGLYGVGLGKIFVGESMFYTRRDASKVALFHLIEIARKNGLHFIDAQQSTPHLISLGAEEIPRKKYLKLLKKALEE